MNISVKKWKSILFQNQRDLLQNLQTSFLEIEKIIQKLNLNTNKIYIHFLRTSILNEMPLLRLEVNVNFFQNDYFEYWEMPFVSSILEKNVPLKQNASSPDRKTELILEKTRNKEAEKIREAFAETMTIWISSLKPFVSNDYIFFYGEYMGPYQKIYLKGEKPSYAE